LFMDGYFAIDNLHVRAESVNNPLIDIISSHHYEANPDDFFANFGENLKIIQNKKPYIIGEFGFVSTKAMKLYLDKIIAEPVSGALIWGLRNHRAHGGFYWHSEPMGYGLFKAYHWPGFESGNSYDEKKLVALMQQKACKISGIKVPVLPAPKPPVLTSVNKYAMLNWKGSVGASAYDVYRKNSPNDTFEKIASDISDADIQYFNIYTDESAVPGKSYYYALKAKNSSGISEFSNISNCVQITSKVLVDNAFNYAEMYAMKDISIETADDRKFKEDMFRFGAKINSELIYRVDGNITGFKMFSYCKNESCEMQILCGTNLQTLIPVSATKQSYGKGEGDYGYWIPVIHNAGVTEKAQYLKIIFKEEIQVSRIEIYYN